LQILQVLIIIFKSIKIEVCVRIIYYDAKRKYVAPWMYLMHREIQKIYTGESDIREYAAKSPGEFFAVVSEYFFERPQDLAREHPELYRYMNVIFKQRL
jgi:MtfA peptidase